MKIKMKFNEKKKRLVECEITKLILPTTPGSVVLQLLSINEVVS